MRAWRANQGDTLDYRINRVSVDCSLSREGGSDSSIIVYLQIGRRRAFSDCRSFIIFGCPRIIMFQSNPVDSSRYAKSIQDNAIMISFVPGKPKVVTGNSSKNLELMSLC